MKKKNDPVILSMKSELAKDIIKKFVSIDRYKDDVDVEGLINLCKSKYDAINILIQCDDEIDGKPIDYTKIPIDTLLKIEENNISKIEKTFDIKISRSAEDLMLYGWHNDFRSYLRNRGSKHNAMLKEIGDNNGCKDKSFLMHKQDGKTTTINFSNVVNVKAQDLTIETVDKDADKQSFTRFDNIWSLLNTVLDFRIGGYELLKNKEKCKWIAGLTADEISNLGGQISETKIEKEKPKAYSAAEIQDINNKREYREVSNEIIRLHEKLETILDFKIDRGYMDLIYSPEKLSLRKEILRDAREFQRKHGFVNIDKKVFNYGFDSKLQCGYIRGFLNAEIVINLTNLTSTLSGIRSDGLKVVKDVVKYKNVWVLLTDVHDSLNEGFQKVKINN